MIKLQYAAIIFLGVITLSLFTFCNSSPTNSDESNNTANSQIPSFDSSELLSMEDGLERSQVYALTVCPNSDVWYGYGPGGQGITKIGKSSVNTFNTDDGLKSNGVYALYCDTDNRVWIGYGVNGSGLTVKVNEDWQTFTEEDGLHSNYIHSITVNDNEVWISYGNQFSGVSYLK